MDASPKPTSRNQSSQACLLKKAASKNRDIFTGTSSRFSMGFLMRNHLSK